VNVSRAAGRVVVGKGICTRPVRRRQLSGLGVSCKWSGLGSDSDWSSDGFTMG